MVLNATTFTAIRTLTSAHGIAFDVDFSYDNTMILTCGNDKKAMKWKVSDGTLISSVDLHH